MGRLSRCARPHGRRAFFETLESRNPLAADPLPVLMVLADRQDFYYRDYGETRIGLEAGGATVQVAATTTAPTYPHPGTGETGSGMVVPGRTTTTTTRPCWRFLPSGPAPPTLPRDLPI